MRCGMLPVALAIGVVLTVTTHAQQKADPRAPAIVAVDDQWDQAFSQCALDKMSAILSDDLIFIHMTGRAEAKPVMLAGMKCKPGGGRDVPLVATSKQTSLRFYGNDVAVSTGTLSRTRSDAAPLTLIFTRVYLRDKAGWRIVSHHATAAPKSEP